MTVVDRVVIGEAVELEVRTARLPSRALALVVDLLIMIAVLVAVLLGMSVLGSEVDDALAAAVALGVVAATFVGYPLLWETLTRGRSPGKYAMGLRVVRADGGPIVFRHALTRALAGFIVDFGLLSAFTGLIGIVVSASSTRGQRIGDLLAGTVVVRERLPGTGLESLPPADPALAAWATGCELSRLPDDLALAARQFLVRAPALAEGVRRSLGERLAADVAARVAPPPPAGVPAEAYLRAVLGERRRREALRLGSASPWAPHAPPAGTPPAPAPPWPPVSGVVAGATTGPHPPFAPVAGPGPVAGGTSSEPDRADGAPSSGGFAPPG